jgi:pimeloyl-ACP methyl ester carboxylesterase
MMLSLFGFLLAASTCNGQAAFVETATSFVSLGLTLPAIVSRPAAPVSNSFWGAVIIHGTGPIDENGTVTAQGFTWRMYRDVALYLSSFGDVAVIRHVKRDALVPPPNAATELVSDYVTDAVNAMAQLRVVEPRVSPSKLVFIGHSLGGTLIVHAAAAVAGVAKIVSLQGPGDSQVCPILIDQYARGGTLAQQQAIAQVCAAQVRRSTLIFSLCTFMFLSDVPPRTWRDNSSPFPLELRDQLE